MNTNWKIRTLRAASLAAAALLSLAACNDSNNDVHKVFGTALSVVNGAVQAQRDFVVFDLAQPANAAPVATGKSDSNGKFEFSLKGILHVYIVFPPTSNPSDPRTSGLATLAGGDAVKTLKDETDIACVAGVTAVYSGGLDPALLDATRIANLEAAARIVIDQGGVDFSSSDSVNAAAAQVRTMTNDGAHPPS